MKYTFILFLPLLFNSCIILPIPHERVHTYGVKGQLVDHNCDSISGAIIISPDEEGQKEVQIKPDKNGSFEIPPLKGWHGAYLIGPISLSLFPGFDLASPMRGFEIIYKGRKTTYTIDHINCNDDGEYIILDKIKIP